MHKTLTHPQIPAKSLTQTLENSIRIGKIATPLGEMTAGVIDEGVCFLGFSDQRNLKRDLTVVATYFKANIVPGQQQHFVILKQQLKEYFAGERTTFTVPLIMTGSDFYCQAWNSLLQIPYGQTRSYREQATSIGNPKAVRAVAQANSRNRMVILIPCHRVIGSNGSLTGYGAGLSHKEWLLNLEKTGLRESAILK